MFNDASILITGATGSFGRRFVAHVLQHYKPARLVVYSRDELKQFDMQEDYGHDRYSCMRYFIGDVRDQERLEMAMRGIDYVVHAAALKQVPAAEYNPFECIHTNVLGAENVVRAAIRAGVKRVLALSTDKAASAINLYGASKLASDKIFVAANNMAPNGPQFSVARYGNVMGSRGSVVPVFRRMIAKGVKELPITDPRMTRFNITLDDGVAFVISCLERMHGGEIFVPKIPSLRVVDLARAIAPEVPVKIVGIRPGEKLHESMITVDDARATVEFDDHYVILPSRPYQSTPIPTAGRPVEEGFEYKSDTNPIFLGVDDLVTILEKHNL